MKEPILSCLPAESPAKFPNFRSEEFLLSHMQRIMDFYHPACLNLEEGGYFNEFRDDGRITDRSTQHLVSTTRFIFNFSQASLLLDRQTYREALDRGLRYLAIRHRDEEHGGSFWILRDGMALDDSKQCYGHAFVLLAWAAALGAGHEDARQQLDETWDLLERRFWEPAHDLYAEEFTRDWQPVSGYRGQNANMHMTEALLTAYEATGEARFLDRAEVLARRICIDLATQAGDLVWEHYHEDWSIDQDYNRDDPKNLFRPYGCLPGHFFEWAKLLLILERHRPGDWILPRAVHFYEQAMLHGANPEHGGLHYSFAPDGTINDSDNYYWVHAEAIAAAACLATRTGDSRYWQDYDRLWEFSWKHFIDHRHGGWYRVLSPAGERYDDLKSPPAKTDYHPFSACCEVLRVIRSIGPSA